MGKPFSSALELKHLATPSAYPPSGSLLMYAKADGKVYVRPASGGEFPQATEAYVQSRGMNLVANGTALLGTNYNFTGFVLDQTDAPTGGGCFRVSPAAGSTKYSDELMPVDPSLAYTLSASLKQKGTANTGYAYVGLAPYDIDGLSINAQHHMYKAGTTTTLAQALNPGDTKIYLTDASNWENNTTASARRGISLWGYVNGKGQVFGTETYTRNAYFDLWDNGAVDLATNSITLRAPWSGVAKPAGAAVSNVWTGSTYKYITASNVQAPSSWTNYKGSIAGVDYSGTNVANMFPPGTAFVRLLFLLNGNSGAVGTATGSDIAVAALWFSEVATGNLLGLGTAAAKDVPASGNATSGQVVLGSDSRLVDARPPTAHSHDTIHVQDVRQLGQNTTSSATYDPTTEQVGDWAVSAYFSIGLPGGGGSNWRSALTVKGWSTNYAAWQLVGPASTSPDDEFYLRSGDEAGWRTPVKIYHTGNFDPTSPTPPLSPRLSTDLPSTYPIGVSTNDAGSSSWPDPYGTIVTSYINVNRAVQTFTAKATGRLWVRTADNDAWTAWRELSAVGHQHAFTDVTGTATSAQLAAGTATDGFVVKSVNGTPTWAASASSVSVPIQPSEPAGTSDGSLWYDDDDNTSSSVDAADIVSGTIDIARLPTGTTGTTVAVGDHTHSQYSLTTHTHTIADVSGTVPQAQLVPNICRVLHDGTAYPARPTGVTYVEWVGPTSPTAAVDGDTWVSTA